MVKKILSMLLVGIMVFGMSTTAFAASPRATSDVAELILYSTTNDDHSFIVVNNKLSKSIKVGHYDVAANDSVTLGTWGNKKEHIGLWYNLEGFYGISTNVSVSMTLSDTQLSTLNTTINNSDSWALLSNCSTFASKVWNSVSTTKVSAGGINTPSNLANSIISKFSTTYKTNRAKPSKDSSTLAYHTSTSVKYCSSPTNTGGSSSGSSRNIGFNTNGNATSFTESDQLLLQQLNSSK